MSIKTEVLAHCPKCGMELLEFTYQGIRIDQCAHCEGIWLDKGEFQQVARAKKGFLFSLELDRKQALATEREARMPAVELERLRRVHHSKCPRCEATLQEIHYRDIRMERCPHCQGIWMDAGELEQVAGSEHGFIRALYRFLNL